MTLEDVKKMDKAFLIPGEAAQILGCNPQLIRLVAKQKPEDLGFPVIIIKSRIKIPRIPFIKYMEGELK